jgi:small-conductance mechanosensitive channel
MFVLSKYAQLGLQRQVLQAFQIQRHAQFIILRFFHYILITIGVLISLNTLGMSFTNLAIIFGGLSIGIGFGLQNTVANLIAGFVLIFERPIKIGDLIEIMDVNIFGRVSSINLRSTIIMALDEKEIIVPNSQLVMEPVHNLTHYNNRYRIHVQVGVSYSSDVELVKKTLLEVAQAHPEVIKEPTRDMENVTAPFVRFTNFGDSSLDFELLAWIPDSFKRFDIASDLHFMVWQKFKEHNIKIPFPQRDVHFYSEERQ